MSMAPISLTTATGLQCVSGVVTVDSTGLIGAVTGFIRPTSGSPIRFRQVVGPAGGLTSVTTVNGQFATLCGNFVRERGQLILNVSVVIPSAPTPTVTPIPGDNRLLTLLLFLLLSGQQAGGLNLQSLLLLSLLFGGGLGGTLGTTGLGSLLGTPGLGSLLGTPGLGGLLGTPGLGALGTPGLGGLLGTPGLGGLLGTPGLGGLLGTPGLGALGTTGGGTPLLQTAGKGV